VSAREAIFNALWRDPAYVALHKAKDAVKPFSTFPNTRERTEALARFDECCAAINEYEKNAEHDT
jgi:hypothetical protein